jgi:hypothetical protein
MKSSDNPLAALLEKGIVESFKNYERDFSENILSDLYIHCEEGGSTLSFYDDMEHLLHEESVENLPQDIASAFAPILKEMENQGLFNRSYISKPFTVSLVDSHFVVTEELIFIDDETLKLEGDIWETIEKDLDEFLKEILK